ncbi:MAG TPA: SDR family NAD(P)-dependent oxidoreductase [Candidatus Binatia bacterium]|jgi:3-oxoacyl-[acyl-carrier protein] reductase
MKLQGKVAVVSGGAQGIGRAIALGLAAEGADVVVADVQREKAVSVAAEIEASGRKALGIECDVASELSVSRLAKETFGRFGRADILVNDAGVYLKAPVVEITEENWDRTINVNLGGNFLCCRAFVPAMRKQKSGRIISIASGIAHYGAKEFAPYAASKAAIIGLVKSLARELGPDGITVNAICPGAANTAMPRTHRSEEELMQRLRSNPLGHVLEPEDFVGPVVFLASAAAAYISGQSINVNCGSYMS